MPKNPLASSFEDAFEQGIGSVKQNVASQVKQTTQSTATQFGASLPSDTSVQSVDAAAALQDTFNETGKSADPSSQDPQAQAALQQLELKDQKERQEKLAQARAHLDQHKKTYFDPTFNQRKKELSVQERLEQEEQEKQAKKMEELQEEKKKEPPIALQQAMTKAEIHRGTSG